MPTYGAELEKSDGVLTTTVPSTPHTCYREYNDGCHHLNANTYKVAKCHRQLEINDKEVLRKAR